MKKSDYLELAQAIKENTIEPDLLVIPTIRRDDFLEAPCAILKRDNPHFDETKFRELLK